LTISLIVFIISLSDIFKIQHYISKNAGTGGVMSKIGRRIKTFSSGIKKLDYYSLDYIHRLTQVLFLVEHPPVYPSSGKKVPELEKKTHLYEMV
jgi:hypothetical protein